MKWAFLFSGIIELIGAILCHLFPEVISADGTPFLIRLYGISALVIAVINISIFFHYQENKLSKAIFLAMMFFHGAIAMTTNGAESGTLPYQTPATLTHLVLFAIFLISYMKDLKPDTSQS